MRLACNPFLLRRFELFSSLSDAQFGALLREIQPRSFPARSRIVHAGEDADGLYVLVSGRANVLFKDADGRELVAASVGPHEFFGEIGVLEGYRAAASVDAQERCETLFVPRHVLLDCVQHNAAAAMAMLRMVIGRLDAAYRNMGVLASAGDETCPPLHERH